MRPSSHARGRAVRILTDHYRLETLAAGHAAAVEAWFATDRIRDALGDVAAEQVGTGRAAAYLSRFDNRREFALGIFTRSDTLIGLYTVQVDPTNRLAAIAVVIGDEASARRGVGEETARAVIDWIFGPLALDKVFARILASNAISAMWAGARLTLEGRLRQHARRSDGTRDDVLLYGLLKEEWPGVRAWSIARTRSATASRGSDGPAGSTD